MTYLPDLVNKYFHIIIIFEFARDNLPLWSKLYIYMRANSNNKNKNQVILCIHQSTFCFH